MGKAIDVKVKNNFPTSGQIDVMLNMVFPEHVSYVGERIRDIAQFNVSPGIGPGPHPHPGRIDTGDLMRATVFEVRKMPSDRVSAFIGPHIGAVHSGHTPPFEYGLCLEEGWTSSKGNFFRYPWLLPALFNSYSYAMAQMKKASWLLASTFTRLARRLK